MSLSQKHLVHLLFWLAVLWGPSAWAQGPFWSLKRGPYLQMPSSSSIVVRWRSAELTDSLVRCGTSPDGLNQVFYDTRLTTEHEVTLSNLQAQTTYYYAVGSRSLGQLYDTNFHFTTAPVTGANRPVRVWFVSDYGSQNEGEYAVRDSYFKFTANSPPADVWLTGGDNDQDAGSQERYQKSVFNIYNQLLRTTPVWPALGNHDSFIETDPGPFPFYDIFTLPTNWQAGGVASGTELYFSFDYGNVHFISLNSILPELSTSTNTAMLQWLRRDLAQTRQPWKIGFWHAPPYTRGTHDSDSAGDCAMVSLRENALPMLESCGLDLVLSGHSHVYERSYLLNGFYGYSGDFSETNKVDGGDGREDGDGPYHKRGNRGAVYVVAAVGALPLPISSVPLHPAHYIAMGGQLGSCMIDINNNRLDFKFIGAETNILDYFTLIKDPPAPRILTVDYVENTIALSWTAVPENVYQVYWQPTLQSAPTLIADEISSDGEIAYWTGEVDPAEPMGFYSVAAVWK